jgi:hypothetical protein
MKDKVLTLLDQAGLYDTPKILGVSIYKVFDMIGGVENLKLDNILRFIKEITSEVGGVALHEINEEPIFLKETDNEYHEIVHLGLNKVVVDVWEGYKYQSHGGEYGISYYNLPDEILGEVFDILVNVYDNL